MEKVEKIKSKNISQVQLRKLCMEQGYNIGQPEISKLSLQFRPSEKGDICETLNMGESPGS